jgi:outer membrane protein
MKKLLLGAALALTLAAPAAAPAQRGGTAAQTVLVVDSDRVFTECTACRAATTQIQQQAQQYNQRAQQLQAPLQTEGQAIETALRALNGRQPDAAMQTRITNFRQQEQTAAQELEGRQQTLRSIQAHVQQQIGERVIQIAEQLRAQRGATVVLSRNSTMAHNPAAEITNEVIAALNQQLPSDAVTPMPQQQQPAPQQQPQPPRPQPSGR